ncbi:FAD-binding oxidoreductase [Arthrobacter sp. SA17]
MNRAGTDSLVRDLTGDGIEVDISSRRLSEYSYDASNYKVRPMAVAFPRSSQDVAAVIRACRRYGIPLTSRGGGTSMAGNAIGSGVIMDFSRHMSRLLQLDRDARTVTVEPGMILTTLQKQVQAATGGASLLRRIHQAWAG